MVTGIAAKHWMPMPISTPPRHSCQTAVAAETKKAAAMVRMTPALISRFSGFVCVSLPNSGAKNAPERPMKVTMTDTLPMPTCRSCEIGEKKMPMQLLTMPNDPPMHRQHRIRARSFSLDWLFIVLPLFSVIPDHYKLESDLKKEKYYAE